MSEYYFSNQQIIIWTEVVFILKVKDSISEVVEVSKWIGHFFFLFLTKVHLQKSEHSGLVARTGSDVPPTHTDVSLSKCTAVKPFWPLFRPLSFPTMRGFCLALLMSLLKYVLQSAGGEGCQWHSSLVPLDLGRTGQCTRAIRSLSIPDSRGRTGWHSHFAINFFLNKKKS